MSAVLETEAELSSVENHVGRLVDRSRDYVSLVYVFCNFVISNWVVLG